MGEILIWLVDCNFQLFTISKLVLRYGSCCCICTSCMKVVYKTKSKIWSHSHYRSPLSVFVQLYDFNFKMVLSVTSCPKKITFQNSFHAVEASVLQYFPPNVYNFYQTPEYFYEHGKFCGFLLLWAVCRTYWPDSLSNTDYAWAL